MIRQQILRNLMAGLFLLGMVGVLAVAASAQGRYSNVYSKSTVKGYIDRLERSSNTFRRDFDRYMDRSELNGTETEDRYNQLVKDYEDALDRLRSRFNGFQTWWESRSNVQEMLNRAQPVNAMIVNLPFSRNIESQWRAMRSDINVVADTYDLPGLAGGGWNGGGGWGGGGVGPGPGDWGGPTTNPPSWAVGTWIMLNSSNSILTINSNGGVTFDFGAGQITYGRYYQGTVYIGGARGTISRIGNNLRFYNQSTGAFTDYSRSGIGGGGGGNDWDGPMSQPPSWAQGTWYAMDQSRNSMTINRNGQITFIVNDRTTYGRYYQGAVYFAGARATISRSGNNMRFYDQSSGRTTEYSRNPWGGGGGGGWDNNSVVGTWRWTSGNDRRTMIIDRNGNVTVDANGIVTNGTYSNGVLTLGSSRANIVRQGNQLRVSIQGSNETYTWYRY